MASESRLTERTLDPTACSYPAAPSSSSGLFTDGEASPMKASTCVSPGTTSAKQSAGTPRWRWQVSGARLLLSNWIHQTHLAKKIERICGRKQWKVGLIVSYCSGWLWSPRWLVIPITGVTYLKASPLTLVSDLRAADTFETPVSAALPDCLSPLREESVASRRVVTGRVNVDGWQWAPAER